MDGLGRQYLSVELEFAEAEKFRVFLKESGIKYEASQAWDLVHFECLMDEVDRFFADHFLQKIV